MTISECCTTVLILLLQLVPVNADIILTDYCSDQRIQKDYTGTINHTVTGKTCQRWDVNHPQFSGYSNWYGDRNYCRNDHDSSGAWCLTTDYNIRWEHCKIPHCAEVHYCPEELKRLLRNCQFTCHCRDQCKADSVNGTCQFGCEPGWTGSKCQTDITCNITLTPYGRVNTSDTYVRPGTTLQISCQNGYQLNGNPLTTCKADGTWSHLSTCQDINECTYPNPCHNRGTCINTQGSYHCQCIPGFKGQHCETDINECTNPSLCHHGTCSNTQGSYHCNCYQGYTGSNCQHHVDECSDKAACNHHGSCINSPGSYHCACDPGYTRPNCGKGVTCSTAIFTSPLRVNNTTGTTNTDKPSATNLSISCDSGYQLLGKPLTTCQNNGTWSNVPSCRVTATYCTLTHKQNCHKEVNCSCQYLCHCVEGDSCDPDNGTCGRGGCSPRWMGKSCQYGTCNDANIAFNQVTTMADSKVVDGKPGTCSEQIRNVSLYFNEVYPLSALHIIIKEDLNRIHLTVKTDTNTSSNYSNSYCFNDAVAVHNRLLIVYCTHVLRSSHLFISFTDRISICEIEVFGGRNIALWRSTSQYGVYKDPFTHTQYNSSLAVDGVESNSFSSGTCSHTKAVVSVEEPWWMINLEPNTIVTRMKLYIRSTDHTERMSNFSVSINNDTRVIYRQHKNPPPGVIDIVEPFPLTINNLKVTIPTGDDRFVCLCEVQIFACIPTSNGGENCQDFCPLNCHDNDYCINNNFQCSRCKEDWAGPFCRYPADGNGSNVSNNSHFSNQPERTDGKCTCYNYTGIILVAMGVVIAVLLAVCVVLCILLIRRRTSEIKEKGSENSAYTDLQMTRREDPNSHYTQLHITQSNTELHSRIAQ